jgi:prepilin-type N-terminal cleavage/methylation domain-containing protein
MSSSARRGFTLIEMALVVAIIAISVSIATLTFSGLRKSERRREIIRTIMSFTAQARTVAMQLGPAAGTPRATLGPTCGNGLERVFSRNNTLSNGRAAIAFQAGVNTTCGAGTVGCCPPGEPLPCDLVIVVAGVSQPGNVGVTDDDTDPPFNGETYQLGCRSYPLSEKDGSILDVAYSNLETTTAGGVPTLYAVFDERGFVSSPLTPAARIGVRSPTGQATTQRGVVILASGSACVEVDPFACVDR